MAAVRLRAAILAAVLLVAAAAAVTVVPKAVHAHSSSVEPLEYTWSNACRRGGINGNIKWCPGPCPRDPVRKNYKPRTYRRGQWFKFVYYKNNHRGGMFRLSLVPLKRRFSSWAHDKNAFLYSCWDAGMVNCPSRSSHACGTDQRGKRYQQWVRLPTVFPDGDYYLGYTWWGGSWQQGDYYSCARIRVRGGQLTASHQPAFTRSSRGGKCWSSATKIGQCRREPCFRKMAWRTPAAFDRRKPKRIFRWAVNK